MTTKETVQHMLNAMDKFLVDKKKNLVLPTNPKPTDEEIVCFNFGVYTGLETARLAVDICLYMLQEAWNERQED